MTGYLPFLCGVGGGVDGGEVGAGAGVGERGCGGVGLRGVGAGVGAGVGKVHLLAST